MKSTGVDAHLHIFAQTSLWPRAELAHKDRATLIILRRLDGVFALELSIHDAERFSCKRELHDDLRTQQLDQADRGGEHLRLIRTRDLSIFAILRTDPQHDLFAHMVRQPGRSLIGNAAVARLGLGESKWVGVVAAPLNPRGET